MPQLILASSSPRRQELLRQIGLDFKVIKSNVEEKIDFAQTPEKIVQKLAVQKALDVSYKVSEGLIIGADTVVIFNKELLGKPYNFAEAQNMLKMLSGNKHFVYTGIAVVDSKTSRCIQDYQKTAVVFRDIDQDEIDQYLRKEDVFDKAGSYAIQGMGALFVEKIEGDYFNVVGLPLVKLDLVLRKFNFNIFFTG